MNPDQVVGVVFSDLDGTLLDSRSYEFDEARPALELLHKLRIPLVLCTSKTRAEVLSIRERMGNTDPFIVENGGGIFIPAGYFGRRVGNTESSGYEVIPLGKPYSLIRTRLLELRKQTGVIVRGFGDMSIEEIVQLTALSPESAIKAKMRDFEEPFFFPDGESSDFLRAIEDSGLKWTRGRFFHLMGNHDKGQAVGIVKRFYEKGRMEIQTIGLGDGLNDLPMLISVSEPVLVRHADGSFDPHVILPNLVKTRKVGPAGWNEAVEFWLSRLTAANV